MHHIISDAWSLGILQRDLKALYAAATQDGNPFTCLSPLPVQYRDFALWQRQEAQAIEYNRQIEYWKTQLQGSQPAMFFCDKTRPAVLSGDAAAVPIVIEGEVYDALQSFCRAQRTTSFAVLLAAFRAAHFRLTGVYDATIGMPVANRNRPELEDMIGFFVNTQCMRIGVEDDTSFEHLVAQVRSVLTAALDNQDVPFERVVSAVMPSARDVSRNPLVQLTFSFNSQKDLGQFELEGLTTELASSDVTTRFDVEFHLFQGEDRLHGNLVYSTDLFNPETVRGIADTYQEVLYQALKHPQVSLASLPFSNAESDLRDMGLLEVQVTDFPREASVPDLFREQALGLPHAIAVTDKASKLTYAELDEKSDKLAEWLRFYDLRPGSLIGVLAPRSCETIITLMGILKANLAYLPFDINVPTARIETILSSIPGNKLVLVGSDVSTDIALPGVELVRINAALGNNAKLDRALESGATVASHPDAKSLAYVNFTSGSTGRPKGVMIEHRGIVRLVKQTNVTTPIQATSVFAHLSNLAFDAATWEIYTPLLNGGTVVCVDHTTVLDLLEFSRLLSSNKVSIAFFTTALLKQILDDAPSIISGLDLLLAGGERMQPQVAKKAMQLVRQSFCHVYGPTENTTFSTLYNMHAGEDCANGVPIGQAISNSGVYVMDPIQQLVPIGIVGELVVTGDGLARGYTDASLNEGRFVDININGQVTRAYRTGDRARRRPEDGHIDIFGRMDQQIKVRGHRIEPAEIEQAILSYPGVNDSVVILVQLEENQDSQLVGFFRVRSNADNVIVTGESGELKDSRAKTENKIRQHLRNSLPSYMVPAKVLQLEELPLNANGKVDRNKLAFLAQTMSNSNEEDSGDANEHISPRNEVEAVICEEVADILGRDVGVTANFFDLGGHSLMAMRLAARLSRRVNAYISVKDVFDSPVLADLANTIQRGSTQYSPIIPTSYDGPVEQSFAQGRLWFLDQLELAASWYIIPMAVRLRGHLDVGALTYALQALEHRHESLRTTFESHQGVGMQVVQPHQAKPLKIIDVSASTNGDYLEVLGQEQTIPFDLASEPAWRVALLRLGDEDHVLSIVMHHIISDGWSIDVLRKELAKFYSMATRKEDLALASPLPIQYRDFAVWQKQETQIAEHERQLCYWKEQLQGSQPASFLCDKPRPDVLSGKAGFVQLQIEGPIYENLQAFCRSHYMTPFAVLLAVFRITHYRLTDIDDATIGTPIANRNRPELEELIGFFVNTQCMRIPIDSELDTFETLVRKVRSIATTAFENQDVPFERIVSSLIPGSRDTSRNPLVQTSFAVHSQEDLGRLQLEGLVDESLSSTPTTRLDLEVHIFPNEKGFGGSVLFATDLFNVETVQNIVDVFQEVLRRGLEEPEKLLSHLPLTDGLGTLKNLGLFEITRTEYPRESSVVDIFEEQVTANPMALAATDSNSSLTYAELNEKADKLAAWLRQRRLPVESLVGVLAPRSCQTLVAYIGILKASLAYLPLDVNVPPARNQLILSTIPGSKLVLLGNDITVPEDPEPNTEWVQLEEALSATLEHNPVTDAVKPNATSLAYVMFTSGSTGRPKGVMIEHRGINRLVKSGFLYNLPPIPRVAHLSNIAFDNSTWEIFVALLNGGTVVCIDYFTTLDYKALASVFFQEKVQAALLLPSLLKQLLANIPKAISALDIILAAGDRFDGRDAIETQRLLQGNAYNAYGPTENSVTSTIYSVKGDESFTNGVPIGRSLNNSGAYIIDSRCQLVSIGVMGELIVTGDGLARGYTDPSLDANRFVEIPIDGTLVRGYRTGDRARFRPGDGQIEFFGRIDHQFKVRGHRMEPAEIEQAILDDSVLDAVVVLRKLEAQEADLVAFFVAHEYSANADDSAQKERDILQRLQSLLPSYMVPTRVIELDKMPLNANGKNDRLELTRRAQTLDNAVKKAAAPKPPRNEIETALCEEFASMLNVEVGIDDNFFDLGGHSLIATKLAARLSQRFHTQVTVKNIFNQPVIMSLATTIQQNSMHYQPIEANKYTGPVEQSFAQGRLWFLEQLDIASTGYLVPLAVRLRGALQIEALQIALQALTQRHETLRTTFEDHDGVGMQVVQPSLNRQLDIIDVPVGDDFMVHLQRDQQTPFNLSSEPGWRVTLFKLGDRDHILSIVMHHIVSDGWSLDILQRELATFYTAAVHHKKPLSQVPALPIQYRDFALWQKQPAQISEQERQLAYWEKELQGSQPAYLLCDKTRPAKLSSGAGVVEIKIEEAIYRKLQTFSQTKQTTLFALLFAAFRATHYRLTGAQDATIGTPIANRSRSELEDLIGFFVNTQCIRTVITEENTFDELISHVKSVMSAAMEHQDVPFERIVSTVLPGSRDTSRNPLIQLMFTLTTNSNTGKIQLEGLQNEPISMEPTTRFDVEFNIRQEEDGLSGFAIFSTDLFEANTIRNAVELFQETLSQCLQQPDAPIASLPLTLGLTELRHMGLLDMEVTEYPRNASVIDVFKAQVAARPNSIAVSDASYELTYRQLDQRSNHIATYLQHRQITPETLIGVLAPRSCETVATLLGVLKANLAYLPLDVNAPTARNKSILSAVPGHTLVLLGDGVAALEFESTDIEQVHIDEALSRGEAASPNDIHVRNPATATSLAYVMFTSGSTGRPKGVMIEHRSIVRLVKSTNLMSESQAAKPIAHISNLAFDAATWEIFAPLLNGGTVVCIDHMTVLNMEALGQTFAAKGVTAAFVTVALLTQLLNEAPSVISGLDLLYAGGDVLRPNDARRARDLVRGYLINVYGPTENTTYSTSYPMSQDEDCTNGVPIGRAISNSGAYVMNPRLQIVSVGVVGELVLTGDGLARGYTDPAFNTQFVQVEIAGKLVKAYRTGDRARYRPSDGQIEFFGRIDQQVKIRGHRVEPAEIEQTILNIDTVTDAAVVVRNREGHDPGLVGFITRLGRKEGIAQQDFASDTEKDMIQRLRGLLPTYMVPEQIIVLDHLPLNANGKVDRRELALVASKTARTNATASKYTPPRNEIELALCEEFTHLLGVDVGITDNFFDLGGHSLMATKLAARISRRLDARISVKDVFDKPTLVDLATSIRRGSNVHTRIKAMPYSGPVKQSFAQGRLWFLEKLNIKGTWYHIPLAVRLRGLLQIDALTSALHAVEQRHETLRTTFEDHNGIGMQIVHASRMAPLKIIDVPGADLDNALQLLRQEQETPFNISSEPGWRLSLFKISENDHILSIVMHHIISDGWSVDVLRKDLAKFYTAALKGQDPLAQVTPLPIQYRDFSVWQKSTAQVMEHQKQLEYWTEQLANSFPAELFCDKPRPALPSGEAEAVQFTIEGSVYLALESFCKTRQVTPFSVLLAAFRATHYRLTGAEDATIGIPIANRNRSELEEMIGFFVNTQCIRLVVDDESFDTLVKNTRATMSAAFENQDVPFERIVSALLPGVRDTSRNPLIQLMFAVHSQKGLGRIDFEGLASEPLPAASTIRFDLEFHLFQAEGGLGGHVLFASDLFERPTISGLVNVFQEILRRGLAQPEIPIAKLPLADGLNVLDSMGLMNVEVPTPSDGHSDPSIVDVFLQQVITHPERVAVKDASAQLTYAQLHEESDRLSARLRQQQLPTEALVGILSPRSCETVVMVLAVLKANLAYLPLDVNTPTARLETILSSATGLRQVLLGTGVSTPDVHLPTVEFASLDEILVSSGPDVEEPQTDPCLPSASNLAYVIFTSGSTGRPKGVMIEHRAIVRIVQGSNVTRELPYAAKFSHTANLAFDMSTWEVFTALLSGGTLICIDYFTTLDSQALAAVFARENINVAMMSPALLKQCLANVPATITALDVLYVGGDRLDPSDATKAGALVKTAFYNMYGPTENGILSTIYRIKKGDVYGQGVPIGRAVTRSGAYIMDSNQQAVSIGVLGELVVTGDGLARGYLNSASNVNRFVHVTINGQRVRAYRTGDRARNRPSDGQVEFFGRIDQQIKIRGHRIEPAEVELAMLKHPGVRDAAIVVCTEAGKEPEMVGFVTMEANDSMQEEATEQVEGWGTHFESGVYTDIQSIDQSVIGNDFTGWTSMYDGTLIPTSEMQEWLDDTMATFLDGKPAGHVLEIGVGTGMILFNLGPGLASYVGLEPSSSAVNFVNKSIQSSPFFAPKAQVHVGTALDVAQLSLLAEACTDQVVINSVAQYFPTADYLSQVIQHLVQLRGVKRIFFGDMRTHATNKNFLAGRAIHALGEDATKEGVRRRVAALEKNEEELLVDPAFFTKLLQQMPDNVWHVEILPKRMKATNELSRYRYGAVIHVLGDGEPKQTVHPIDSNSWVDFQASSLDRHGLVALLKGSQEPSVLAVSNIPCSKTLFERLLSESLITDDNEETQKAVDGAAWISEIRRTAEERVAQSIALSALDLAQIANEAGFHVELSWARQRSQNGGIDAVFHRLQPENQNSRVLFQFPTEHQGRPARLLANRPIQRQQSRKVAAEIKESLQSLLPSYMIPAHIIALDQMPVNANGKVDRRELAREAQVTPINKQSLERIEPRNDAERTVCESFTEVLGVEVGITDNFFELGGHSLMATRLAARLGQRMNIHVSVRDIFEKPSPVDLAKRILDNQLQGEKDGVFQLADLKPFQLLHEKDPEGFVQNVLSPQLPSSSGRILDSYPVSGAQKVWLHNPRTKQPWQPSYFCFRFRGESDVTRVREVCAALVNHFELFRTVFLSASGKFYGVVLDALDVPTEVIEVEDSVNHMLPRIIDADKREPLCLGYSMLRLSILKERESGVCIMLRMNHALYDGISLEHIVAALQMFYRGEHPAMPPKFIRYIRFMRQSLEEGFKFWRSVLEDSSMTVYRGDGKHQGEDQERPNGTWTAIKMIKAPRPTNAYGITPATMFTAACALVFGHETGSEDVVFGRVVSGRQCLPVDLQHVVGPCAGPVPVRVRLEADVDPVDMLRKIQEQYVNSMPFEMVGLESIRENCTDWPETTTDFSCCIAYQSFNMSLQRQEDDRQIQTVKLDEMALTQKLIGDDPSIERGVSEVVSQHHIDVAAEPQPDGVHVKIVLGMNRRLCQSSTVDRVMRDICDRFQMLGSVLQDAPHSL